MCNDIFYVLCYFNLTLFQKKNAKLQKKNCFVILRYNPIWKIYLSKTKPLAIYINKLLVI